MNPINEVRRWLEESYGLNLDVVGAETLERNIRRRAKLRNFAGIPEYVRFWRIDPEERDHLLEEMLVSETWFFREPPAFEVLKQWLLERMSYWTLGHRLRILVLPCASGEEAWSVAAIVHSLGIPASQVEIEAMDVNTSALHQAQAGRYPLRKLKDHLQLSILGRSIGDALEIGSALRPMVCFEKVNAMDSESFASRRIYDVIFCRNLLIYMRASARARVFDMIARCLAPEGLLFMGHAEQPLSSQGWQRLRVSGAFAWQRQKSRDEKRVDARSGGGRRVE